jgi:hypothetical protein
VSEVRHVIHADLRPLAAEISRTAEIALDLERISSALFRGAPTEWQAMDMLVQRLFALRDFVDVLCDTGNMDKAIRVVRLEDLRVSLTGARPVAELAGEAELF